MMFRLSKKRGYWIAQIVGWTLYTFLQIIAGANKYGPEIYSIKPGILVLFVSEGVFFFLITHYFRHVIIKYKWLQEGKAKMVYKVVLSTMAMGFFIYALRVLVSNIVNIADPELTKLTTIIGNTAINTMILFLWSLFYFVYHYFERFSQSLKYEAALNEIELNQLKSQLNPHFIFNALNSIRALVGEEPNKAKNAITQLSNILRNSLATDRMRLTPFEEELDTVKDYLGLESIRYEERLKMTFDIDPDSYKFSIPPLMLQTLVENGIKHGIATLKGGGLIKITTVVEDSRLAIKIRNSGQYRNGKKLNGKEGFGLSNTIQRLHLIDGNEAKFRITNENHNTVLTELIVPLNI